MAIVKSKQETDKSLEVARPAAEESRTSCPVCGSKFKRLVGLSRHLARKHGIKILEDIGVIGGG